MSIRTFWIIVIKVIALFLIINSFDLLAEFVSQLFILFMDPSNSGVLAPLFILFLLLGLFVMFVYFLFFKTNWIIDKLQLESGIKENAIDLQIGTKTILKIALFVLGGFMLTQSIPRFLQDLTVEIQISNHHLRESPKLSGLVFNIIKSLIGYLLIYFRNPIADYIDAKSKSNELEITVNE